MQWGICGLDLTVPWSRYGVSLMGHTSLLMISTHTNGSARISVNSFNAVAQF